jgi:peptide deformylase
MTDDIASTARRHPIAQLGQSVLRRVARPVPPEAIGSAELHQLIDRMLALLQDFGGVGLAGPQVFVSQRLFLAAPEPPAEGKLHMEVFINPQVTALTEDKESAWEGCLSFPELSVLVPRYKRVRVDYVNLDGQRCSVELADFAARVVQHENDHLDGILTIDRALSTRDIVKASELETVLQERAGPAAL